MFKSAVPTTLLFFFALPVSAQDEAFVLPVPDAFGTISASYFDEPYLLEQGVQHLGVDIPAPVGSVVVSPISGTVIINRTDVSDPFNAFLVIRSKTTGFEHLLAHLKSDIEVPMTVTAGDPIGKVVAAGTGPHLHYGINQLSVTSAIDTASGWGFGRAPAGASPLNAGTRGWLAPNEVAIEELLLESAASNKVPEWWLPGLVLEGAGEQNDGSTWTIKIEVQDETNAKISYDSIPCAGRLKLISASNDKVSTTEEITENTSNCITGGVVEIDQTTNGSFNYRWKSEDSTSVGLLKVASQEGVASDTSIVESAAEDNAGPVISRIGEMVLSDGVLDASTIDSEGYLALALWLGLKQSNIPRGFATKTGDVFEDTRNAQERVDRLLGYAEQLKILQQQFGAIRMEFTNVLLEVPMPRLNIGFFYANDAKFDISEATLCGLPSEVSLFKDELDSSPYIIYLGYPRMETWTISDCGYSDSRKSLLRAAADGEFGILRRNFEFSYKFTDLGIGEPIYRGWEQAGATADYKCVINHLPDSNRYQKIGCNVSDLRIKSGDGKQIYTITWSGDAYEEEFSPDMAIPPRY